MEQKSAFFFSRYLPVWLLACLMPAMMAIYLSPEKERFVHLDFLFLLCAPTEIKQMVCNATS